MSDVILIAAIAVLAASGTACAAFDGSAWNVSTGNLSVGYIQASPIGAHPRDGALEAPPPADVLKRMKDDGLYAYEDYVAWGAVEREPGKWDWKQHDAVCDAVRAAGLKYVVYNWTHFPPVWLRDEQKDRRTLMRCLEHQKETNYLSIFDPATIGHYDRYYKELAAHFGDRIDGVYACILGPYGEGNYPLNVPDWVNIGHCHEGYWVGDRFAQRSFAAALKRGYGDIGKLNAAWGTGYSSFAQVEFPEQVRKPLTPEEDAVHPSGASSKVGFVASPDKFKNAAERRRWIDFIGWYHQALIDFAERSAKAALKYFPREKVRTKPGGNAGGVNPIAWGTYCPAYAKMAAPLGITLQPADCRGAYFGDKWIGTAYQFYGVRLATEPAGDLSSRDFVKRIFSDVSCGASQIFTYQFDTHSANIRKYAHLYTGQPSETQVAVLCPTTLYRLGGNLWPSIAKATALRDYIDYDVLDELLIEDGALADYSALVLIDAGWVEQTVLEKIEKWVRKGGKVVVGGDPVIRNVEGQQWRPANPGKGTMAFCESRGEQPSTELRAALLPFAADDGKMDGVWTSVRRGQTLLLNLTDKPVLVEVDGQDVEALPGEIAEVEK